MFEKVYRYGNIKKVNIESKYFADCPKGWRVANNLVCGKQKWDAFALCFCCNLVSQLEGNSPRKFEASGECWQQIGKAETETWNIDLLAI